MVKSQTLVVAVGILTVQLVYAGDDSSSVPSAAFWRTAGLLVGTIHDEQYDRDQEQWLPFDWTWNLVLEDESFENAVFASQKRADELWAMVDASDSSTRPLPDDLREQLQIQLLQLDPDLDRQFELTVWIRNGMEVIRVPTVEIGDDFMVWEFPHYDSRIEMSLRYFPMPNNEDRYELEGEWIKQRVESVARVPFRSSYISKPSTFILASDGQRAHLFNNPISYSDYGINRESRWAVSFSESGEAVAQLAWYNTGPRTDRITLNYREPLLATFLTPTGDFRFLSGFQHRMSELCGTDATVYPQTIMLSCFDGAHAFLFTALPDGQNGLKGNFYSGNWHHETWTAVRDDDAQLPDAFEQTTITDEQALEELVFKDTEGHPTRVLGALDKTDAKARVLEIFGTWCPNCADASRELVSLKEKYGDDLGIVGLAFEVTEDFERSSQQVKRHHEHIGSDWEILIAGLSDKDKATKTLGFLDKVRSYPTLVFLNSVNEVQAVYSGFSGPATGDAYTEQRLRFEALIDKMIEE